MSYTTSGTLSALDTEYQSCRFTFLHLFDVVLRPHIRLKLHVPQGDPYLHAVETLSKRVILQVQQPEACVYLLAELAYLQRQRKVRINNRVRT